MPSRTKTWVYILANRGSGTLYIGVTTDLRTRMWQHRTGVYEGFTKRYRLNRLVYFEEFQRIRDGVARERVLKGWARTRKIAADRSSKPGVG